MSALGNSRDEAFLIVMSDYAESRNCLTSLARKSCAQAGFVLDANILTNSVSGR